MGQRSKAFPRGCKPGRGAAALSFALCGELEQRLAVALGTRIRLADEWRVDRLDTGIVLDEPFGSDARAGSGHSLGRRRRRAARRYRLGFSLAAREPGREQRDQNGAREVRDA